MQTLIETRAYAKLNLGLKILGKRPDGYHDILSVLQTVDLFDTLIFEEAAEETTQVLPSDPALPAGAGNLVHRAVQALRESTGIRRGVRVHLTKRIPAGGGLGGGSADAAATLLTLKSAWDLPVSDAHLLSVAAKIGSDVPFFLRSGTAIASGRGEILRYVKWPSTVRYVLANPPFSVSTRWAYQVASERPSFVLTARSEYVKFLTSMGDGPMRPSRLFECVENDFEPVVTEAFPALSEIRRAMLSTGPDACVLTGSGSVLYSAFFDPDAADRAGDLLRRRGHQVLLCGPLIVDSP